MVVVAGTRATSKNVLPPNKRQNRHSRHCLVWVGAVFLGHFYTPHFIWYTNLATNSHQSKNSPHAITTFGTLNGFCEIHSLVYLHIHARTSKRASCIIALCTCTYIYGLRNCIELICPVPTSLNRHTHIDKLSGNVYWQQVFIPKYCLQFCTTLWFALKYHILTIV